MRRAILAAVIGLTSAVGVDEARAQFSFGNQNFGITVGPSYGGGYGYGGNGYRGYGPGYGGYGPAYRPSYNLVVPVAPRSSGGSYVRRSAPIEAPRERPGAGLPIKIVSPDDAGVALSYSLNEFDYTIAPGESQTISNDREWIITFDRGGEFGTARYSLAPGLYSFKLTEQGWQVYHDADLSKVTGVQPTASKTVAKNVLPVQK